MQNTNKGKRPVAINWRTEVRGFIATSAVLSVLFFTAAITRIIPVADIRAKEAAIGLYVLMALIMGAAMVVSARGMD